VKGQCKECGGSGFCEHGRRKSKCKDCRRRAGDPQDGSGSMGTGHLRSEGPVQAAGQPDEPTGMQPPAKRRRLVAEPASAGADAAAAAGAGDEAALLLNIADV
jgi:hypothetical protein